MSLIRFFLVILGHFSHDWHFSFMIMNEFDAVIKAFKVFSKKGESTKVVLKH